MALKINVNGVLTQIGSLETPPVVFIGGQKKVLSKGITFINGEKKILWGTSGVTVGFINLSNISLGLNASAFYASKNSVYIHGNKGSVLSQLNYHSVTRINIQNPSSPQVVDSGNYGFVSTYSAMDSSDGQQCYFASYGVSTSSNKYTTINKIVINSATDEMTVSEAKSFALSNQGGYKTASGWLHYNLQSSSTNFYLDSTQLYSNSIKISVSKYSDAFGVGIPYTRGVKYLRKYPVSGAVSTFATFTTIFPMGNVLCDSNGNVACAGSNGFGLVGSNGQIISELIYNDSGNKRNFVLLGRSGDYYYALDCPSTSSSSDQDAYLKIISASDGTLFENLLIGKLPSGEAISASYIFTPWISQNKYFCYYTSKYAILIKGY